MPFGDKIAGRYPHLRFQKHWKLDGGVQYLLGGCDALVDAIRRSPLQPEYRESLLQVSMIKGAQATTAIEGNTLTESEIRKVAGGESLAPSKGLFTSPQLDALLPVLDQVRASALAA